MFKNESKKKKEEVQRLAVNLRISVKGTQEFLKRASGFLSARNNFSQKNFLACFFILDEIKKLEAEELAEATKVQYNSKNIYIVKYQEKIVDLYMNKEYGYTKISKQIKLDHNISISKSTIERFIKSNNLDEERKNGKS